MNTTTSSEICFTFVCTLLNNAPQLNQHKFELADKYLNTIQSYHTHWYCTPNPTILDFLTVWIFISFMTLTLWLHFVCWFPEGKECPTAPGLEEWRVCNDHPCTAFYWEASPWGPCIEETSKDLNGTSFWNGTPTCAVGVQIRKVSCTKMNVGPVISKRYSLWPDFP